LSVELNSSYSIDEVNVRFNKQRYFGQGSNGNFVRNTGASFGDIISSRSGAADVNTAGSYFVSDRGNTYYGITKKTAQIILVLLIMMGSLVLDTQATRTFH
jgi:hypothetical protein